MDNQPERIMLLNVPLDIVDPENLPLAIDKALKQPENKRNMVLLSLWDLLRARRNPEYHDYVLNAALVIPISHSLISGARFLTGKKPVRYMPFNFIISLLSILEKKEGTLFLLGSGVSVLRKTEKNLRTTFPGLNVVGRCDGKSCKKDDAPVKEAIRKTSSTLLLAGKGIRGGELWIARNSDNLNSGIRLWCSDLFDILAEKRKRPSDKAFELGIEGLGFCLKNPLRLFRIFAYIYYKLLLLFYRLFKNPKKIT